MTMKLVIIRSLNYAGVGWSFFIIGHLNLVGNMEFMKNVTWHAKMSQVPFSQRQGGPA